MDGVHDYMVISVIRWSGLKLEKSIITGLSEIRHANLGNETFLMKEVYMRRLVIYAGLAFMALSSVANSGQRRVLGEFFTNTS